MYSYRVIVDMHISPGDPHLGPPHRSSGFLLHVWARVAGPPYCGPHARCGPVFTTRDDVGRVCFDRITKRYFWTGGQHWEFSLCDRWSERGSVLGRDVGQGHRYMFDKREIVLNV